MKNIVYILTLISLTSFAQIEKGKKYLGGDIKFNYVSTPSSLNNGKENSLTILTLSPKFLYFLSNNFAVGLSSFYSLRSTDGNSGSSNELSIGPVVRYTKLLTEKVYFFGEANVNFGSSSRYNGLIIAGYINLGVTLFLSKKFALEAAFASFNVYFNKNQPSFASISFNPLSKVGVSFYF